MKEQRADPNLTVIIKLIESGQLQKRKQHGKDTPEGKIFAKNQEKFEIGQGHSVQKDLYRQ